MEAGASESNDAGRRERELERQLANARLERDLLQKDVEALCLQSGRGSLWSSSTVMIERLRAAEGELARTQAQLMHAALERDGVKEDLVQVKSAKRDIDNSLLQATQRTEALAKELAFYQGQAATVLAERDAAAFEAEQLKRRLAQAEQAAREGEERAAAQAKAAAAAAQAEAAGSARDLAAAQAALEAAQRERAAAEQKAEELRQEVLALVGVQQESRALFGAVRTATERAQQLEASEAALQQQLAAAQAERQELSQRLQEHVKYGEEMAAYVKRLQEQPAAAAAGSVDSTLQAQLEAALQEKEHALQRLAALEDKASDDVERLQARWVRVWVLTGRQRGGCRHAGVRSSRGALRAACPCARHVHVGEPCWCKKVVCAR